MPTIVTSTIRVRGAPRPPPRARRKQPNYGAYGVVGLGALAIAGSGNVSPGGAVRVGVGYQFDGVFSFGILGDLGMVTDSHLVLPLGAPKPGSQPQLWARLCVEPTFTLAASSVGLHAGPHVCGVYTHRSTGARSSGGTTVRTQAWLGGYTVGGFIGVSFPLEGTMRLWVRGDVDALSLERSSFGSVPWAVVPTLSVLFSW